VNRFILFIIFFNTQFCQSLATINPKTYFKPDLKRKESRLTGCQILVLKESNSNQSLNNPFLKRSLGFSQNTRLLKKVKVSLNGKSAEGNARRPITFKKLRPGNQTLIIETPDFKLPLNFSLRWEEEMLVLVLLPKVGKVPIGALLKPKKILAGVEFRQMLSSLQNWREKTLQATNLTDDPADWISNDYVDQIGKKEDFVDFLTVWKKRLKKLEISSYVVRPIDQKSRLNIRFIGHENTLNWTKCLQLILNNQQQVVAYENKECSQNSFVSWIR
tara:strand:+ start:818 stop:1639 length:822 start_codon:yes stop_codon:yes gene_type:complete